MKLNSLKYTGLVASFFLLASCDRELDQFSTLNEAENIAMSTPQALRMAMDGAYDLMKGTYYYSSDTGSQIIMGDVPSDNLILVTAGRNSNRAASNFEFTADNAQTTGLYNAAYGVIAQTNFVLKYVNAGIVSGTEKDNLEAEARALRALAHFDLVRAYAKIPTQSADAKNSMGLFYSESFDPSGVKGASRNLTVEQFYKKIIADLEYAKDNIGTSSNKNGLTKPAILGLLSRVYLYMGDYKKVIEYGDTEFGLTTASVTSLSNFNNIWKSTSTDGILFQVANSEAERVNVGVAYNQSFPTGIKSEYVVDYDLFQLYSSDDVRKDTYFTTSNYEGKMYNHVTKYMQIGTGQLGVVPVNYLRSAEVLLNVAEAYYREGNEVRALELLNKLRTQRYSSYTAGNETGAALLDAILLQRRLELFGENDRWYTLKRLGLGVQRSGKGDIADGSGTKALKQTLNSTDTKWQWPIPNSAIRKNKAIIQNPGY